MTGTVRCCRQVAVSSYLINSFFIVITCVRNSITCFKKFDQFLVGAFVEKPDSCNHFSFFKDYNVSSVSIRLRQDRFFFQPYFAECQYSQSWDSTSVIGGHSSPRLPIGGHGSHPWPTMVQRWSWKNSSGKNHSRWKLTCSGEKNISDKRKYVLVCRKQG